MKLFILLTLYSSLFLSNFSWASSCKQVFIQEFFERPDPLLQKVIVRINGFDQGEGNGFFIGPNKIVTSFHALSVLSEEIHYVREITISQGSENHTQFEVEEIQQLSILDDLVIFKVKEISPDISKKEKPSAAPSTPAGSFSQFFQKHAIKDHLKIREGSLDPKENLTISGYHQGKFLTMRKTGDIRESENFYVFPVSNINFKGTGSPVLDDMGRVVGIVSFVSVYTAYVIKIDRLKNLLKKKSERSFANLNTYAMKEMNRLERAADKGSVFAQYRLAVMYFSGKGLKNYEKAAFWFEKAANQDLVWAQSHLGYMYYKGIGVKVNYEKAFYWYSKAAEKEYHLALFGLYYMYSNGRGVLKDTDKSFSLLKKAAEQGYIPSYHLLISLFGKSVEGKDTSEALLHWLKESATQGDLASQQLLAMVYQNGRGRIRKNLNKAIYWYERSGRLDKSLILNIAAGVTNEGSAINRKTE